MTRRERLSLGAALAAAVGLAAVGVLGLAFETGRRRDAVMLEAFTGLDRSSIDAAIRVLALSVNPVPYSCVGLVLLASCLKRRLVWRAAAVAAVLVGSGAAAQVLKQLLDTPRIPSFNARFGVENIGWPSGHATAATALVMCAVIVAPPAWRAAVALAGGAWAVALAHATLALTWHYPSEVLGGVLLGGAWGATALLALARLDTAPVESPLPAPPRWLVAGAAGASCVAAAVVAAASESVGLGAADRWATALCAFAIAALIFGFLALAVVAAPAEDADEGGVPWGLRAAYDVTDRRKRDQAPPVSTRG
jgi:membrane-associated phospholipid phosphatase